MEQVLQVSIAKRSFTAPQVALSCLMQHYCTWQFFRCQQTTALTPVVTLHLLPLRPCSKTTISCNIAPCKSLWPSTVCQACSVLHCRFAHLVNYGGSYYSYAYAMCLASSVWEKLFQDDPLSRHAGTNHLCVQQSLLSLLHCHAHCNSLPQQHVL